MKCLISGLTIWTILSVNCFANDMIKEPNVAGQFYPADPVILSQDIKTMMQNVDAESVDHNIDVLIVPHAGHIYSGPVAAHGFKAISQKKYKTIILLGPTHYHQFSDVSIWPEGGFKTPLGTVDVDTDFSTQLMNQSAKIKFDAKVFEKDHVLEVELPFLQTLFNDFKIVPMIMSRDVPAETLKEFAATINSVVGERQDVLLLISSDLSHFHDVATAKEIDERGLKAVLDKNVEQLWIDHYNGQMEIDGFKEVIVGLLYAAHRNAEHIKLLNYGHSGMVTGDNNRVVGYASMIMFSDDK